LTNQLRGNIGEQRRGGRRAPLVGYGTQTFALGGELKHGLGEVAAMGADHPAGTQDQVARIGICQCKFAIALGATIDTLGVGWIFFAIGAVFRAIKDVVRRVMHDHCAELG